MRKCLIPVAAIILLISIFLTAGCGYKARKAKEGEIVISAATAQSGKLSGGTVVSGKLEALRSANLLPKTSGKVGSIPVDIGSEAAEGDLLLSLDAPDLAALVDLYAAQLDKARNSDLPAQKNQAEYNLANAEATFRTAEADFQRNKQLIESNTISRQQFEQSEKAYLQAKASYESAQNALDILVGATIPETIRQYEAQLNKAQADYANTMVKAPFSGVVTARNVNPGEYININVMTSSNQAAITLVNLDTVLVQASVGEDQVNKISVGQEIKVKVGSVQNEPFTGTVTNIALAANPASKAYPVKIQIQNPGHILKPGMFAEVFLHTNDEEGIIIPREALLKDGDKDYVYVIENGRVARREVIAGHSDGKSVIIRSGLKDGEAVATSGTDILVDGMNVSVQN
ncbi:MAG: efflux RND transporter periplasmic adaptor subunit [Peptococcaceae bacterium]|nr:efflux RND transporter periplasmic adaptor subunit [Peptococcaceae bacterium]